MKWQPTSFFTSKATMDPEDSRLIHRLISSQDREPVQPKARLWGYADDEGVSLNGGRPGARFAPAEIRRWLYRMTPSLDFHPALRILDLGDLTPIENTPLALRHENARSQAQSQFASGELCISLGAGHDYGYADGAGFLTAALQSTQKPVILNIDAHLDVRPTDRGMHSGTPFRRLLEEFPGAFHFLEFGLQAQCNSVHHASWVRAQGGKIWWLDEIRAQGWSKSLQSLLSHIPQDSPLWISFDIDALSSAVAPGCSQSWATGLSSDEAVQLLQELARHKSPRGLSIYEVSPPLDLGFQTSKTAALLIYQVLRFHRWDERR